MDCLDADDLDDGYEGAEAEEAHKDELFLVGDLCRSEKGEGKQHAV